MSLAGKKIVSALAAVLLPIKPLNWCVVCASRGRRPRSHDRSGKSLYHPISLQAVSGYPVSDSLLDPAAKPLWAILSWVNGLI